MHHSTQSSFHLCPRIIITLQFYSSLLYYSLTYIHPQGSTSWIGSVSGSITYFHFGPWVFSPYPLSTTTANIKYWRSQVLLAMSRCGNINPPGKLLSKFSYNVGAEISYWRVNEASETLSGLHNWNQDYLFSLYKHGRTPFCTPPRRFGVRLVVYPPRYHH